MPEVTERPARSRRPNFIKEKEDKVMRFDLLSEQCFRGVKHMPLAQLDRMLDWAALLTIVRNAIGERGQKPTGRPSYSDQQLLRFTVLRLTHLCSSNEACAALRVRIDWRLFCGFNLTDSTPDASTVNRYWRALEASDALHPILARVRSATIAKGFKLVPHRGRPAPYPVLRRGVDDGVWTIGGTDAGPM